MLQRMNELAVQSANGTNSATDRKAIQDEVDQLTTEIDRVSETTKFNETYLLKGDSKTSDKANFMKSDYNFAANTLYLEGSTTAFAATADGKAALKKALNEGKKVYTKPYDQTNNQQTAANIATKGKDYAYVTKLYDADGNVVSADEIKNKKKADGTTITGNLYTSDAGKTGHDNNTNMAIAIDDAAAFTQEYEVNGKLSFNLHVGADSDSNNKISVDIDSMDSKGIGVKNLKVDTEDDATAAIDRISEAISKVSSQRSSLGAVQNRLEHTINNLDNVSENTTSAESRIRDTDMAKEMVNYSKNNILAQAGQSMLAQANQSNQGVLSLLQ